MKGGYIKCSESSRSVTSSYTDLYSQDDVDLFSNELVLINNNNIQNWKKLSKTYQMPRMLKLTWKEYGDDYFNETNNKKLKKYNSSEIEEMFIPKEFIVYYSCESLFPLTRKQTERGYGKRWGLLQKKACEASLYGSTHDNKYDVDNKLPCATPCQPYKKCGNYNCCDAYGLDSKKTKVLYCNKCNNLHTRLYALNLFEVMRQIYVAKCAVSGTELLPYILNPVSQEPFTADQLNNFVKIFTRAIATWKKNLQDNKTLHGRVGRALRSKVGTGLTISFMMADSVFTGGSASLFVGILKGLVFIATQTSTVRQIYEINRLEGKFKEPGSRKALVAGVEVGKEVIRGIILGLAQAKPISESVKRWKSLGSPTISGPLISGADKLLIPDKMYQIAHDINFFKLGIPIIDNNAPDGVYQAAGLLENLVISGYSSYVYKINKIDRATKGELTPRAFESFDTKLNSLIIREENYRAAKLSLDKDALAQRIDERSSIASDGSDLNSYVCNRINDSSNLVGGSYNYIVNPKTGRKVKTDGKVGQSILKKYKDVANN